MPIRSLLVQHDRGRGGSWVNGGRVCPGDAGADVGWVAVGNDFSQVRHVSGVLGPDGIGGDKREDAGKIVFGAQAAREGSCFLEPRLELLSSVIGEGIGEGEGGCGGHDGWMDGWMGWRSNRDC